MSRQTENSGVAVLVANKDHFSYPGGLCVPYTCSEVQRWYC